MKTPLKLNPISYFTLLFIAAISLCLATFWIAFFQAPHIGTLTPTFEFKEIYWSEPWEFNTGDYRVQLSDEAVIAPVYNKDEFIGMTFQTDRGAVFPPGSTSKLTATGGFFTMDNETFLQLKGDTLFSPVEDRTLKSRLTLSARQLVVLPTLQAVGHERIFFPAEGRAYAYLDNNGKALDTADSLLPENRFWLITYFGLQFLIALLFAQMLTLDLSTPKLAAHTLKLFPSWRELAACVISLLLLFGIYVYANLPVFDTTFSSHTLFAYLGILVLLILLAWKHFIARQFFGLTLQNIFRSILISLVLVLILTVFSALKFPGGLSIRSFSSGAALFSLLFISSLSKELFWRGFMQTLLERITGRLGGLLLTTALVTGFYFLAAYTQSSTVLSDPAKQLELFFFLPGLSLILGYVFLRSRNILSSTLLHTLIIFIPQIVIF